MKIEQELSVKAFELEVANLSERETKQKLVELYIKMVVKDNYYRGELKKAWDIPGFTEMG